MNKTMSLKLDKNLFLDIKKTSKILNISCSEFIRNAIKKELEVSKSNFLIKMSNVPYCSEEEEKEIIEMLDNLTEDDLKVVKKDIIEL